MSLLRSSRVALSQPDVFDAGAFRPAAVTNNDKARYP